MPAGMAYGHTSRLNITPTLLFTYGTHPRGGALGRRQADAGSLTAHHHTKSHVPMAPEGHCDPLARVDFVVPVGRDHRHGARRDELTTRSSCRGLPL